MSRQDTWCLPEVKRRLLSGQRITQAAMIEATQGRAWRLSAAIHYLRRSQGWGIASIKGRHGWAEYWLPHAEIQRLRSQGMVP